MSVSACGGLIHGGGGLIFGGLIFGGLRYYMYIFLLLSYILY